MKILTLCLLILTVYSCKQEQKQAASNSKKVETKFQTEKHSKPIKRELIDILNDSLKNVIEIDRFIDSISEQNNVRVLSTLTEEWNDKENFYYYSNSEYSFKLKQDIKQKNGEEFSNTLFFDGNHKIDFSKHSILKVKDKDFKSEDFGFNNFNSLNDCKIIQIGVRKFMYANVTFMCNGIGCGCQINMIYDLKNHSATFIENYSFPYSKFFISDFNNDNNPDLLVIAKNKEYKMIKSGIEEIGFKVFWYENNNGNFIQKKDSFGKPYYFKISGLTTDFNHDIVKKYSLTDYNWKK